MWGVAGLVTVWLFSRIRLDFFRRLAPMAYGLGIFALVVVLVFGVARGGNRAWLAIGPLTIQPSEFARLATILLAAAWLCRRNPKRLRARNVVVAGAIVALPMILVAVEPDLGVALTYLPIFGAILWLGGLPRATWIAIVLLAVAATGATWQIVLKPYQQERIRTILDPDRDPFGTGYQVRQSKIAVGSGGTSGQGLGRGTQSQLHFLPAQHTDFAFAVWSEATGFAGATILLLAYAVLLGRISIIALTSESRHGMIVAALIGSWLTFQVVVNLGMVLGWLPTAGITLPLFSYGGSSLLATCAGLGIVQSVWRHRLVNQ